MSFVYAFLIGGVICALAQVFSELKVPFPLTAILFMGIGGGLLTRLGLVDVLNALGTGGVSATAVGCGNGAYNAGAALAAVGNPAPLILTALLNIVIVAMGAISGLAIYRKFPQVLEDK